MTLTTALNNKTIEFMFAGINMFLARVRLVLAGAARRFMPNIFIPKNINSITIIITLEDIGKIKT